MDAEEAQSNLSKDFLKDVTYPSTWQENKESGIITKQSKDDTIM
jgi:hypothetical protein